MQPAEEEISGNSRDPVMAASPLDGYLSDESSATPDSPEPKDASLLDRLFFIEKLMGEN